MRILFANDGIGDAGGVQAYLASVMPALAARGHAVALLHEDRLRPGGESPAPAGVPHFCTAELGVDGACDAALAWVPDVCFTHNMRVLHVDRRLAAAAPTVKMMHGYFGTCIGGQKAHLFPGAVPCGRRLGPACLALYLPRRCGRLNVGTMLAQHAWAREQNALFATYAAFVVASSHMRDEYVRNGADPRRVHAIPLFPTAGERRSIDGTAAEPADAFAPVLRPASTDLPILDTRRGGGDGRSRESVSFDEGPRSWSGDKPLRILFLGRMTRLKGGDLLIRAVARAGKEGGARIHLTMAGDGPQRSGWRHRAGKLGVDAEFPGWAADEERDRLIRASHLLAVPSVWPEPFGLVGPEAGAFGVPAVAFDVGGIGEWLRDGENGWLLPGPPREEPLADALARIARDPDALAARSHGARAAADRLSLGRHVAALEAVLAAADGRSPPSARTAAVAEAR
ncbi:MAG: hypothetical protein JWM27_508 [Gemmatimonadetes bacterium]|nr:hypothetical protein [Gemmatimonadota bacterium]